MISVRLAKKSEMSWVNECYDKVEFVHSDFDKEIICIAEVDGEKAGLGRLVRVNKNNLELGGIYVLDSFRGKGIAKEIVKFLIKQVLPVQNVFCIPFEHLLSFYKGLGFVDCIDTSIVPEEILKKYHWCKEKYSSPTALLILKK